jgi:hypothetical protein
MLEGSETVVGQETHTNNRKTSQAAAVAGGQVGDAHSGSRWPWEKWRDGFGVGLCSVNRSC